MEAQRRACRWGGRTADMGPATRVRWWDIRLFFSSSSRLISARILSPSKATISVIRLPQRGRCGVAGLQRGSVSVPREEEPHGGHEGAQTMATATTSKRMRNDTPGKAARRI
jgi:hypothetical protein